MKFMTVWKGSLRSLKQNKILSMLGLATRASAVVSGEFMTEKSVKSGAARLVIVGNDTKEGLGHAMGKEMRASLAITDDGFAKSLIGHLEEAK